MSSTTIMSLVGIVTFAFGLAGGLVIGERSKRPESSKTDRQAARDPSPGASEPSVSPNPVERTPSPPIEAPSDTLKVAEELWDLMTSSDSGRTAHNERQNRIRDLKPEMAAFFISKFQELRNSMKADRQKAMELAIACGGPDAVKFVRELAEDPAEGIQEFLFRIVAADSLSRGHLYRRPKDFPVDEPLLQRSETLLGSVRGSDRRLAIVILGFTDVHRARPAITDRLRTDPDPVVREEAVRQLGRIGNEATLTLLRAEGTVMADQVFASYVQPQPVRGGPPVRAADKNGFIRVLNDAIEELEERLQPK